MGRKFTRRSPCSRTSKKRAIWIAAALGMVMALSGWLAFYMSGSEALLLDGNFSFIGVVATLAALKISSVKTQTSKTYPFGKFVFEATYSLLIGVLTVGGDHRRGYGKRLKDHALYAGRGLSGGR